VTAFLRRRAQGGLYKEEVIGFPRVGGLKRTIVVAGAKALEFFDGAGHSPLARWTYIVCKAIFPGPVKRFQQIWPALAKIPVESF